MDPFEYPHCTRSFPSFILYSLQKCFKPKGFCAGVDVRVFEGPQQFTPIIWSVVKARILFTISSFGYGHTIGDTGSDTLDGGGGDE